MSEINQKARIEYLRGLVAEYRERAEKAEGMLSGAQSLPGCGEGIAWRRVNDESFEYAIQQGPHGDEFVKLLSGACLKRAFTPLPAIPDNDADFTPDLARKIIAKYQQMLAASPAPSSWQPTDDASPEISAAVERTMKADYKIGWWLSAALEDPAVCAEMKADINAWFEAHQPGLVLPSTNSGGAA